MEETGTPRPLVLVALLLVLMFIGLADVHAQTAQTAPSLTSSSKTSTPLAPEIEREVRQLAVDATRQAGAVPGVSRVEIVVGQLDARLRLAACAHVQPYLPPGGRLWGRSRIGLRCTDGPVAWNVYLPLTVKIIGQALVANVPMAAGATIGVNDVSPSEIDLAEDGSPAVIDATLAVGRILTRALNVGDGVRQAHLKQRQWFAAGDTVKLRAVGEGFVIGGEGQAMSPGVEGQPVRVRTESGRVVSGMAVADRTVELSL